MKVCTTGVPLTDTELTKLVGRKKVLNIDGKKFRVLNMSQGIVFSVKETIERFDRVWGVLPSVDKRYDYNIFVADIKKGGGL